MKPECASCGSIGYLEPVSHPVGDYVLCGACYRWLLEQGHVEIERNNRNTFVWLYPDGHTETVKYVSLPEPHYEVI